MYVLLTFWMVLASVVRLVIEIDDGEVDFLPFIGMLLGILALAGIHFGRVKEPD